MESNIGNKGVDVQTGGYMTQCVTQYPTYLLMIDHKQLFNWKQLQPPLQLIGVQSTTYQAVLWVLVLTILTSFFGLRKVQDTYGLSIVTKEHIEATTMILYHEPRSHSWL
jgi:hypothetical protein